MIVSIIFAWMKCGSNEIQIKKERELVHLKVQYIHRSLGRERRRSHSGKHQILSQAGGGEGETVDKYLFSVFS